MKPKFTFKTKLWRYHGNAAWHFVTLPKNYAKEIKSIAEPCRRGFGAVKVHAQIGKSQWQTSIFPDAKIGSYLLPVKKAVREQNKLLDQDPVIVFIELSDF